MQISGPTPNLKSIYKITAKFGISLGNFYAQLRLRDIALKDVHHYKLSENG